MDKSCKKILDKRKAKDRFLKRKYGVSIIDYDILLSLQNGLCAICGRPPKTRALCVDHNHKTGKIRGLLCYNCNKNLIGRHTDYKLFLKAAEYLKRSEPKSI